MWRPSSLVPVEERLEETLHWAASLRRARGAAFGWRLSAFLSSARSVTFVLQKTMSRTPGFAAWFDDRRSELRDDPAARFFLELRNYSQKQGAVHIAGSAASTRRKWVYCFAGNPEAVPDDLRHRDVAVCAEEHAIKLARLVLAAAETFPSYACPRRALTPEGLAELGVRVEDVEATLGLPSGFVLAADAALAERLALLGRDVQGLDWAKLRRWSRRRVQEVETPDLLRLMVDEVERRRTATGPQLTFAAAIAAHLLLQEPGGGRSSAQA